MHDRRQMHWNEMEKQRKSVLLHIFAWVCKLCLLCSGVFQGCCARRRSCLWKGEESSKGNTRGRYYLKLFLISVSSLSHCCTKAHCHFISHGWLGHSIQRSHMFIKTNLHYKTDWRGREIMISSCWWLRLHVSETWLPFLNRHNGSFCLTVVSLITWKIHLTLLFIYIYLNVVVTCVECNMLQSFVI